MRTVNAIAGTLSLALWLYGGTAHSQRDDDLAAAAEGSVPATIATIKKLAAITSGSDDPVGLAAIAGVLEERLRALEFETERHASQAGSESIVGQRSGTGFQRILLMAHMDTVFEPDILARMPIRQEDAVLYGPGVIDAKGGIAIILHTLELLAERSWENFATLTILFTPDEEIGSPGSAKLITRLASQSDIVLSFEIGGDHARNIAWIIAGTASYVQVTMEVTGRASHAGNAPEEGRNALVELAHQILSTRDVAEKIADAKLNWTNAVSDKAYNQIPDRAVAVADVRVSRQGAAEELLAALQSRVTESSLVPDTKVTISMKELRPGFRASAKGMKVAELAQRIYGEIARRQLYIVPMVPGATDAGYAAAAENDPVVLEGMGPAGRGLHSHNEALDTDSIAPTLYQVARLLMKLGAATSE